MHENHLFTHPARVLAGLNRTQPSMQVVALRGERDRE